ncbi:hypothetical protein N4G70_34075 [Streptomyces sp. ASQP_92]|uniref:hypothetical protein n=1 Tax=Streptomyces sp. ASQP_92 TaxID=2979116 RepID=UPI0021C20C20|nr:hypothetical protein [Streptomyces sp. ASQP_92]MCT9093850.1 hypothetical protein [Streptomyces sp. ASQP_92]
MSTTQKTRSDPMNHCSAARNPGPLGPARDPARNRPAAARLTNTAAIPGSVLTAGVLMANEVAAEHEILNSRQPETSWETEGGACTCPSDILMGRPAPEPAAHHICIDPLPPLSDRSPAIWPRVAIN